MCYFWVSEKVDSPQVFLLSENYYLQGSSRGLPQRTCGSGLPSFHRPSVSEDDLKILFSSNGGVVKGFKFFQ